MLRTAAALFQTQGYHATGLNQVLADGGTPKGSLYFHFPGGKEQLAAEALDLAGDEMCRLIKDVLESAASPVAAVEAIVEHLATAMESSGFTVGCPIATVALDAAADSDAIRSACDRAYRSWLDAVAEHLARHGIRTDRAESLAVFLIASIEGALLLARTRRDVAPLRAVAAHLRLSIVEAMR